MKILVAPDSFKGSLNAPDAARAIAIGLRRVWPDAQIVLLPVADGGEGTARTLAGATGGWLIQTTVAGPLGDPTPAVWARLGSPAGDTAVVEMAEASGLTRIAPSRRNPRVATSRGTGELIRAAVDGDDGAGAPPTRLVIGLGGTATNDGGAGLLRALGVRLLDTKGNDLPEGGAALAHLARLDAANLAFDPSDALAEVVLASDVNNPLCGPRGASHVFGPQKGASEDDVAVLDAALARWGDVLAQTPAPGGGILRAVADLPGAGAAGGAGAALLWLFPQARLRPGIDVVLDAAGFDDHLVGADLVLTGEGRLDAQTLGGKAALGVARRAAERGVPCAALVGAVEDLETAATSDALAQSGLLAVLPVVPGPCALSEALEHAPTWLADAAERAARWLDLGRRLGPFIAPAAQ